MKHRFMFVILVVALLLQIASATTPKNHWGTLKGVITDVYKARLVNALVMVEGDQSRRRMVTNAKGEFEVALPAGKYLVTVDANGFRSYASPEFQVKRGKTQELAIELDVKKAVGLVPASSNQMPRELN